MKGLVSVMIPCFNGEKYVGKLFDSFLEQTYTKIHLILVDDGSTDKTKDVVLSYVKKFERVGMELEYIWQENGGVSAAINTALKHLKGEFCMWIDSDDYITPNHVERKVATLLEHPEAAIVRCQGICVGEESGEYLYPIGNEKRVGSFFEDVLIGFTVYAPGLYMVRTRELFDSLEGQEIFLSRAGQNIQLLGPIVYHNKIIFIQDFLFYYTVRRVSVSHGIEGNEKWRKHIDIIEKTKLDVLGRIKYKMSFEYYRKLMGWIELKTAIQRLEGVFSNNLEDLEEHYIKDILKIWLGNDIERDPRKKYIWGANYKGKIIEELLNIVFGIKVSGYVDSNYKKMQGVESPETLNVEEKYVIVPLYLHEDILEELEKRGYTTKDFTYPNATLINDIRNYNKER